MDDNSIIPYKELRIEKFPTNKHHIMFENYDGCSCYANVSIQAFFSCGKKLSLKV
jgi:hypothetical protein